MKKRLDTHVTYILIIFAGCGSILAIIELFSIVLACCLANSFTADDDEYETEDIGQSGHVQYSMR